MPVAVPSLALPKVDRVSGGLSLPKVAVVAGLVVAGALAAHRLTRLWSFTIDDAYISARYARHVALGYGPVYNPGEPPVEGTSNLLYLPLLSVAALAGADLVTFGKLIGLASGAGILYVSYRCVRVLGEGGTVGRRTSTRC